MSAAAVPTAAAPPADDARSLLDDACKRRDKSALDYQTKRRNFAIFVALLGPVAGIAVASHWYAHSPWPILIEAVLMLAALALGGSPAGHSHPEWVRNRLRAELLRRAVKLGPYDLGTWGYFGWPLVATGRPEDRRELHEIVDRLLATSAQPATHD